MLDRVCALARASLSRWSLGEGARVRLLNVSENATFLVEHGRGVRHVLRIHRGGYHSHAGIASELAWLDALHDEGGVITPRAHAGIDGELIQQGTIDGLDTPRHMVLFDFIEGVEPDESQDLIEPFRRLGEVSARVHRHAERWQRPSWFERLVWVPEHVFGPDNYWGDWREGPGVTARHLPVLQRVEDEVIARLQAHGRGGDRFGLAHCDLRLANLLIVGESTRVIDFDDCGLSWYLYDLATALTLIDNLPQTPDLIAAWLEGYMPLRALPDEHLAMVPTLIMMRRMAILAWMGTHPMTDLARQSHSGFADETCAMAEVWLARPSSAQHLVPWRT
jgi:Ser/Thr protein kinase RdoA (MazF antagonist)